MDFRNCRTWGSERLIPVSSSITAIASFIEEGGLSREKKFPKLIYSLVEHFEDDKN
jgi:hypothetical protein